LVLNAPVTLIPVFSTTGASPEVGALPADGELVGDGWPDEGLDPADEEREPDEQALSDTTAASSTASSVDPPRNRARTTLPIDFHSVVRRAASEPNPPNRGKLRGDHRAGQSRRPLHLDKSLWPS
jgi:hypothetical protein